LRVAFWNVRLVDGNGINPQRAGRILIAQSPESRVETFRDGEVVMLVVIPSDVEIGALGRTPRDVGESFVDRVVGKLCRDERAFERVGREGWF
jgi:hypothetical protein